MLSKNDVLALRDFALSHLPDVKSASRRAYTEGHNSKHALMAVANAPISVIASPLSSAIERQAAQLLHLVGKHPDTHTEWLNDDVEGDDFPGQLTAIFKADSERDRDLIDQLLLEAAQELSRLSAAPLPPALRREVDPSVPEKALSASPPPREAIISTTHKIRTNSLDASIEKAIRKAGRSDAAAVYVQLRELALGGEPPFSGAIDEDALCYTNDKNEPDKLTKNALSKRLKRSNGRP